MNNLRFLPTKWWYAVSVRPTSMFYVGDSSRVVQRRNRLVRLLDWNQLDRDAHRGRATLSESTITREHSYSTVESDNIGLRGAP